MYLAAKTQAFQRTVHHLLLLPLRSSHTPEVFLKFYIVYSYFIVRFTSNIKVTICLLQYSINFNLTRSVVLLLCYDAASCRSSNSYCNTVQPEKQDVNCLKTYRKYTQVLKLNVRKFGRLPDLSSFLDTVVVPMAYTSQCQALHYVMTIYLTVFVQLYITYNIVSMERLENDCN